MLVVSVGGEPTDARGDEFLSFLVLQSCCLVLVCTFLPASIQPASLGRSWVVSEVLSKGGDMRGASSRSRLMRGTGDGTSSRCFAFLSLPLPVVKPNSFFPLPLSLAVRGAWSPRIVPER